jgi:asparagine synthase (glutamine-hydrolysing)
MCGIVGIVRRDARHLDDLHCVRRMLDRIVHRGPDDEGIHQSGPLSFGMRRLSIIDLAGGHQPIANEDGSVWVVCNGEIYNFRSVRRELEARGHRFATRSDTEILVHAYEEWGDKFLDHVEGMFGFALWDEKASRLLLVRDRLGVKPVYYSIDQGRLSFASEIKSLLVLPWMHVDIDEAGLLDHLTLGYAVAPTTIFRDVKKLAPAECLVWERGEISRRFYWQLPHNVDHTRTESEWVESIREELDRAVEEQMVADVPLGAFLSGGVDSSALVGIMSRKSSNPVNTYSIGYSGSAIADYYNELPYARQIAVAFGTHHREIPVAPNVAELLPHLIWHLEEPVSDTAIITTYLVSKLAAQSVKVIISGVGGDELFAGYNRYLGDHYASTYRRLPNWLRSGLIEPVAELLPSGRSNRFLDLARYAKEFVRAGKLDWRSQYKSFVRLGRPESLNALFETNLRGDGYDGVAASTTSDDPLLRLLTVDARTQLSEMLLLLSDKMTMATSIECRVPLLDQRLVELAATIPSPMKLKNGRLKHLFKDAVRDVLPSEVLQRRKRGFGAPVGTWLSRELEPLRAELLGSNGLSGRGLFSSEALKTICRDHDARKSDYADLIMVLVNLEIWCRLFLDGSSSTDISESLADHSKAA